MEHYKNLGLFEAAFSRAWLRASLGANNPEQYLDHPDVPKPNNYRYFPSQITRGGISWNIGNMDIFGPDRSFSIPGKEIRGVFINIKESRVIIAMKNPQSYWGEDTRDQIDPFDRYPLVDYDFRVSYTCQVRGKPVLTFNSSTMRAIRSEQLI